MIIILGSTVVVPMYRDGNKKDMAAPLKLPCFFFFFSIAQLPYSGKFSFGANFVIFVVWPLATKIKANENKNSRLS